VAEQVKKLVYMVDDDITMCDLVGTIIRKRGYEFEAIHRYEGALEAIAGTQPDLVLLDLHLPDGSGLNLCQTLKKHARTHHLPVFMLTTREFSIEKEVALQSGAEYFFHKPFDRHEFVNHIDAFLSPSVEIEFFGVRGSTPCANKENMIYGGNTTCMEIRIPNTDELLILDSGSGIRNLGNKLMKQKKQLKGNIFITHPHWDHIQGFPFFKPIYVPQNQFTIHMPQQISGGCKEVLAGQMTYTYFPVTPEMLMAEIDYVTQASALQEYNGYKIEFMLANHPVTTAIYKIHIDGTVIIFCPDNELIPSEAEKQTPFYRHMKEFFRNADIVIHDAQYDRAGYGPRRNWGHSAWEEATELCAGLNVKHLYLTHHDPDSSDEHLKATDKKLGQYASHFHTLKMAREGMVHRVAKKHTAGS
jgi:phosphoribosyl 1,2-cyclic phosphodiesterase/ActR/RegA family two-component response regulator